MSDAMWYAIFTALPPTIAAFGAWIMDMRNHKKLSDVHDMVNGRLETVTQQLGIANEKVLELQKIVVQLEHELRHMQGG